MIKLNNELLSLSRYHQRTGQIGRLFLYDGTPPTIADVKYALHQTKEIEYSASYPGMLSPTKFTTWAAGRGNNYLGSSNVDAIIAREDLDDYFANFPLSRNTHSFVDIVDSATPTWFIYHVSNTTGWANKDTNNLVLHSIAGTVGAEGSEADMILPGGILDVNSTLKTNDILVEEF